MVIDTSQDNSLSGNYSGSTCMFPEEINYEIILSKAGYSQNPQKYVAYARRTIKRGYKKSYNFFRSWTTLSNKMVTVTVEFSDYWKNQKLAAQITQATNYQNGLGFIYPFEK